MKDKFSINRRKVLHGLGFSGGAIIAGFLAPSLLPFPAGPSPDEAHPVFRVGEFRKIYDPSSSGNSPGKSNKRKKEQWYINDHTFIRAGDGQWHLFGITHREPANPEQEKFFAHATAPDLFGPWTKQEPVLPVDAARGETVVWAPYVLRHDGLYWMFYCAGGSDHRKFHIHAGTSADLWHWTRHAANPMVVDGYDARDPMVLRVESEWVMYYAATSRPEGGNHTVNAATSADLSHWSHRQIVFADGEAGTFGGPTESPFVVPHNGKYYLFVCTNHGYSETAVYESETPFHWDVKKLVGKFPAHAAEVIQAPDGKWFVSRAGWGQGGVYLAELTWEK